jgi:putative DNA primase/helicase
MAVPRIRDNDWVVGHLVEHGPAKYQFEDANSLSYYVKLRTRDEAGERFLWGADLKRAIKESKSRVKVGQVVAARLVGREALAPRGRSDPDIPSYRNRWEVETPQFVAQRVATAKKILEDPVKARRDGAAHPELAGLYLALRGAELIAKHRYPDVKDQERFVTRVREALAQNPENVPVLKQFAKDAATKATESAARTLE